MNLLIAYAIGVLVMIAGSLLVIYNFWQHRYSHDLTPLFIVLFIIAFIATIFITFAFVDLSALSPS